MDWHLNARSEIRQQTPAQALNCDVHFLQEYKKLRSFYSALIHCNEFNNSKLISECSVILLCYTNCDIAAINCDFAATNGDTAALNYDFAALNGDFIELL